MTLVYHRIRTFERLSIKHFTLTFQLRAVCLWIDGHRRVKKLCEEHGNVEFPVKRYTTLH